MSSRVIYLPLKPFVREWARHSFGNPVRFPQGGIENSTLLRFTQKTPPRADKHADMSRADIEERRNDVLTAVCLPDSKMKAPETYCYLTAAGEVAVIEAIENTFTRCLWMELSDMSDVGCSVMSAIYAWCSIHGISMDYAYTIRQRYYRLRNAYVKRGVDLRKRTKDKSC